VRPIYRKNSVLRRSQAMWGNRRVWRPRLVFWAGALAIGVISVAFAKLSDMAQHLFHLMTGTHGWTTFLPLIITPLGFGFCAFMAMRFFPNAQGSGIPQAIAARHLTDDDDRARLLSLKMVAGKILLTIVGLFCGASIGREGPTVQVGASLRYCHINVASAFLR
jgi:H+/Cl- antiporter ClcA